MAIAIPEITLRAVSTMAATAVNQLVASVILLSSLVALRPSMINFFFQEFPVVFLKPAFLFFFAISIISYICINPDATDYVAPIEADDSSSSTTYYESDYNSGYYAYYGE